MGRDKNKNNNRDNVIPIKVREISKECPVSGCGVTIVATPQTMKNAIDFHNGMMHNEEWEGH